MNCDSQYKFMGPHIAVTERLGVESQGGMARIGAVHYNAVEALHRLGDTFQAMA